MTDNIKNLKSEIKSEKVIIEKSHILSCKHGFSTRYGGVSSGIFSSLNLGMRRGDDKELVKENYRRFFSAMKMTDNTNNTDNSDNSYNSDKNDNINNRDNFNIPFVCGNQVHSNYVHVISKEDAREAYVEGNVTEADGFVTNIPGIPLVVFTADCVPVLMEDTENSVIAAVHSGWRSTVSDIENEAINKMISLGANIQNIKVAIGPAICGNCFEVGQEVIDAVNSLLNIQNDTNFRIEKNDISTKLYWSSQNENVNNTITKLYKSSQNEGKYYLDLRKVIKTRLLQIGILPENIDVSNECTMCNPDKYWSHRYTKGERGSMANAIML